MTTIKDIAKAAGVSITTVSRALNGYSDVNEKTRQKIIDIAKQLNYSPNTLARGLVMNKSKTIGLLVSGLTRESAKDNFTFEVLAGVNQYVGEVDYDMVLFSTTSTKQREKTYTQLCRERRVDGAILQGIRVDDPYLQEVVESDIPCVLIDIPIESETVGYVTTDNVLGAKKAVRHLVELGHKCIAMINGYEYAFVSEQRLKGFKEALFEADLPFYEHWVANGAFKEEQAEQEAIRLLTEYPDITAFFCASDLMALGVMKAVKQLGKRVPDDVAVIGYDDIILASYATPTLSTIAQNKFAMGYEAAKLLIQMLEGKAQSHVRILETELKMRESTVKNHK
ncbi:LacI family DNA-binding transcriptional regulator [Thermaerobacillus caldiproteolyticus]|uniref:LacI family transcriptional regulator n=1 Tax=Thermaerobacillus caldiproteolyticus TaxID=247480 RepID=A0A7W0BX78_9BACL|nr:LacI family DNA-binding transcriptional regulator [Anoxybacillus caldiproteolyticus]MBA2874281.1 LacI family transcriptional regulator [Anoxybacillus caldiproteolyticus]QPA31794.1 LacI family DNA-binding transcriptional regulator [Anoxybacillus caldiproteolyticus]